MAMRTTYTCTSCSFSVEDWDEGNPYIVGPRGWRYHFYHPGREQQMDAIILKVLGYMPDEAEKQAFLEMNSGDETTFLCESCAAVSRIDATRDRLACKKCRSPRIKPTHELEDVACPKCKDGVLKGEPSGIS
jgi:DNA-directed RNA polymerase subunit RPC12/RpoP